MSEGASSPGTYELVASHSLQPVGFTAPSRETDDKRAQKCVATTALSLLDFRPGRSGRGYESTTRKLSVKLLEYRVAIFRLHATVDPLQYRLLNLGCGTSSRVSHAWLVKTFVRRFTYLAEEMREARR